MTDPLDELRTANPVDERELEVPRRLLVTRAPRRRGRLPLALAVAAALVVAAVVLARGTSRPVPSLAARAYAAAAHPGVVHWRTRIENHVAGRGVVQVDVSEGWSRGGVTHALFSELHGGRPYLETDTRTEGGRTTLWTASDDDYMRFRAHGTRTTDPMTVGDPFATFRRAYRAGRLTKIGPSRFAAPVGKHETGVRSYYDIDPATARPRRYVFEDVRRRTRLVFTFAVYETLPDVQANRAKLELLRHPGAGGHDVAAAPHYALLRDGAPPQGEDAAQLRRAARGIGRRQRLDLGAAREIAAHTYLVPGDGHICIVTLRASGSGLGCTGITHALARGIGVFTGPFGSKPGRASRPPLMLVVPDDVVAVKALLHGRTWKRVPVHDNRVVLAPELSYRYVLAHR